MSLSPQSLFFIGCIPTRLLLAYLAYLILKNSSYESYKPYLFLVTLIIGLSFMVIYTMGWRKSGQEAGGKIWWNSIRPIHSVIYILFAIGVLLDIKESYMLLLLDVFIGIYAEIYIKSKIN